MPRGRKPGFRMSEEHRVKIQNSNILNALIEHADGTREMSSTQVQAGLGLLKKVLPDLASVTQEITGEINHTHEQVKNDADAFESRIAGLVARSAEDGSASKPH